MRKVINAAIIDDKKILLVRKGIYWILPGGKLEGDESDLDCLCREVEEELSGTKLKDIEFYKTFQGRAPHRKDIVEANVYFAKIDGELNNPSGEIQDAEFAKYEFITKTYNLSDITRRIIESFLKDTEDAK
jgi:8-oxo-dGTP pyrophosphatase MutT (NUDIX family)